jgi:hypothetical protein
MRWTRSTEAAPRVVLRTIRSDSNVARRKLAVVTSCGPLSCAYPPAASVVGCEARPGGSLRLWSDGSLAAGRLADLAFGVVAGDERRLAVVADADTAGPADKYVAGQPKAPL